jgi:predicted amidohydrolase
MPLAHTIFIQCHKSKNDEHFIPQGVYSINVPPSCKATLPHHVIISDLSYQSKLELMNYKWMLSQDMLIDTSYSQVEAAITATAAISATKSSYPTLNKV